MTTAAWSAKEGVLAVDTQVTSGNRKFRTHKVARLPCGGLIAGTGNLVHILKVTRWVQAGYAESAKPEFGDDEDGGQFECLIIQGDGQVVLLDDDMEPMPVTDEFIAIGSGGNYAMGAMACGKTAVEAVKIAAQFDAATSEPVEAYFLEEPEPKRAKAPKARKKK
jgi:ATP-dependent protease HslVU (ClpYQ) peptidase subunit